MKTARTNISLTLAIAALLLAPPVAAKEKKKVKRSQRGVAIEITYGTIESVETVKLKTKAGQGAAVGGLVGLSASEGNTKKNLETAAVGAAVGALLTKAFEKHKAQQYQVRRLDGSEFMVVIDHADAAVGDCVAVEQGSTTNLRRVSVNMCSDGTHHQDESIASSHTNDAEECHVAKEMLLETEDEAAFERALTRVKVLCH